MIDRQWRIQGRWLAPKSTVIRTAGIARPDSRYPQYSAASQLLRLSSCTRKLQLWPVSLMEMGLRRRLPTCPYRSSGSCSSAGIFFVSHVFRLYFFRECISPLRLAVTSRPSGCQRSFPLKLVNMLGTKRKPGWLARLSWRRASDAVTRPPGANVVQRCTQSWFGWSRNSGPAPLPAVQIQRSEDSSEHCTLCAMRLVPFLSLIAPA